ncbi:SMC N, IncA, CALCOCO1 and/or DUF3584 domain containing protein [Asbolus verrucosus]|uniref:SMC N, IncA, CALCOCO1 and/or DUF3584 domain containing protein n=1 Tax=Asbolus verrucosus TaxID=1661398 RepID=A0A482VPG5_ASBVE|nr:SMC N, IncA, CALCOCO1 and/or DUF3584 domain containing protein [Asbolus verrucosus]
MSETDDTDELLIIPPDFFLNNPACYSDNLGPYYGVVDSLITQVNQLEDRINFIESSSEVSISLLSNSPEMQSPSRVRKFGSSDDLQGKIYSASTQNTPQKPRTKFTLNSLPNSPDVDRFRKTPPKPRGGAPKSKKANVNPMLEEIDSFVSNVKLIKRLNAVRNLENDFSNFENKNLDMHQLDEMLNEMDLQQKKMEKDKEKPIVKEKAWQAGDNVNTVPDYGYGMRKNMYRESQQTYTIGDTSLEKNECDSSSESTQTTAFEKFKYKEVNQNNSNYNLGLVSLSKLWNSSDARENPSKFQQQLQEERLRRQHCEQAIQELQNRILELQERVAVAIQVDEAKDKAILRFHDSWEKAGSKLQEIEKEKEKLEEEVDKLKKKLNEGSEETYQKVSHYEKEASKALNIAHSGQEKLAALEKRYSELENELKTAEVNSEEFQKKYLAEVEKNRQYPEIIAQKEMELNDCKSVLAEARKEVSQSKRAIEICQSELLAMKEENDGLQTKLNAEKESIKTMNDQKSKLLEEINAHKSIGRGLQEELTKTREQLENNKIELKNFYQGQVELVVQNKLKEFQKQLDEAEKALKDELTKKELSIAKTAASHIQQISEKHTLEIKLLEEKHQEECRLYQLQISQLRHELDESNLKIKRQNEKHMHIEKQLHKFMESLRQDHFATLDEMHSFRSKSFNNLEEILSFNMAEEERNRKGAEHDDSAYRMGTETPLTSRNEKGARRKENSLQETINMLLDKRPQGDKGYEEQAMKEGGMGFYQRMSKDMKGKPPWK